MDDLFWEYIRLLRGMQPRAFIAENVKGLVIGKAKGYFKRILADLTASGYDVQARVLDAKWLGIPQSRGRVFFVGFRRDLGIDPARAFPSPVPYQYTLRDVLPALQGPVFAVHDTGGQPQYSQGNVTDTYAPTVTANGASQLKLLTLSGFHPEGFEHSLDAPAPRVQSRGIGGGCQSQTQFIRIAPSRLVPGSYGHRMLDLAAPCPTVTCASPGNDLPLPVNSLIGTAVGAEWAKLKPGEQSSKYFNLIRAGWGKPSPAILASHGGRGVASVAHPLECRKFTIDELRLVCAFPSDFTLVGSYSQQWARLGNSVLPLMARSVGLGVLRCLMEHDGRSADFPRYAQWEGLPAFGFLAPATE